MQYSVPILFILAAIIFTDPLMVLMPSGLMSVVMVVFFVSFSFYVATLWNEKSHDERDEIHRTTAGHRAYLIGAGAATLGVLYQAITVHDVDSWLVVVLVSMVLTKTLTRYYMTKTN